ncbi:MAG: Uma2 family endonuclease [Acidobacteriota bacterium]
MPAPSPPIKLTHEDYLNLPEDGKRHELIDGEHYATRAPFTRHQILLANLFRALDRWVDEGDLGRVLPAPVDVVLSEVDVVQPDLLFLAREHLDRLTEANVRGAPDLVVEIVSESTRKTDEITKRHLYERYGVPEYWIVDPVLESVKVYRGAPGERYARASALTREAGETGDSLATPLLPGLKVRLEDVFR